MKKAILGLFILALVICIAALSQDTSQSTTGQDQMKSETKTEKAAKLHHLRGTIGEDGKTFVADKDKKSWTIQNPDAVKGHEGHHVSLAVQVYPDKDELHVVSLKMAPQTAEKTKKDEMEH